MRGLLKWGIRVFAALLALLAVAGVAAYAISVVRLNQTYTVKKANGTCQAA